MLYYQIPGHSSSISEMYDWKSGDGDGDILIVGGGGVFNPSGISAVELALRCPFRLKILWGCGLNGADAARSLCAVRSFHLSGMRELCGDYADLAPCPSCKSPEFDDVPEPTTDVVIYDHWEMRVPVEGFPRLGNNAATMRESVRFLASGDTILTNSYHGAYWGMLLGRKVLIFYRDFPHRTEKLRTIPLRPKLTTRDCWREDLRRAVKFDGFLSWCRYKSDRFYARVVNICT